MKTTIRTKNHSKKSNQKIVKILNSGNVSPENRPKSYQPAQILSHMDFKITQKVEDYEMENKQNKEQGVNMPSILENTISQTQWNPKTKINQDLNLVSYTNARYDLIHYFAIIIFLIYSKKQKI